jgi:3-deoxy-manno-octulosonate cytidylyltransferase (CMP-KDO synthetase)
VSKPVNIVKYRIVIPARYASTRLPGKALRQCAGKPLLQRVYEQACKSSAEQVVIATDDSRIEDAAHSFGATVVMTGTDHVSGSDRISEAVSQLGWPDDCLLVNLQGDEPLMPPECLDQVAALIDQNQEASVASLWWPIESQHEFKNPNAVKVVTDQSGLALYFSRASVPGSQMDHADSWQNACRHIGLYAYRAGTLKQLTQLPPGTLEQLEHLEQLRWLAAGHRIVMARADHEVPAGVDTESDLHAIENILENRNTESTK